MSEGQLCPCICPCRQYARNGGPCLACLGGWHTGVCASFSAGTKNGRLVPYERAEHECGTCGQQRAAHR